MSDYYFVTQQTGGARKSRRRRTARKSRRTARKSRRTARRNTRRKSRNTRRKSRKSRRKSRKSTRRKSRKSRRRTRSKSKKNRQRPCPKGNKLGYRKDGWPLTACYQGTGHRAVNKKTGVTGTLKKKNGVRYWSTGKTTNTRSSRRTSSRKTSTPRYSRTTLEDSNDWKTLMALRLFTKNREMKEALGKDSSNRAKLLAALSK